MKSARAFFDQLNQDYLELHRLEGDLYWLTHTGQSDEHDALGAAGLARKTFLADPQRLAQIRRIWRGLRPPRSLLNVTRS